MVNSIPLPPETVAALKARREQRLSRTATDIMNERRHERTSSLYRIALTAYCVGATIGIISGIAIGVSLPLG